MAAHRIICTRKEHDHGHITHVGIGSSPQSYDRLLTLSEAFTAIARGDTFYTISPSTGKIAQVHRVRCPHCTNDTLRSGADAVTDNNLDNLPNCG